MRQAIVTKYHGPTNTRGSRITARAEAGSVTVDYDHALNAGDNHLAAARRLAEKLGWSGDWFGGGLPSGGYCFVCADRAPDSAFTVEAAQ